MNEPKKSTAGYYLGFGLLAILLSAALYIIVSRRTEWPFYATWVAAWSGATFLIYGLDKLISPISPDRVPEACLHALAMLGGFAGGWLGMAIFRHKTNEQKKRAVWFWLTIATFLHAALTIYLLVRRT